RRGGDDRGGWVARKDDGWPQTVPGRRGEVGAGGIVAGAIGVKAVGVAVAGEENAAAIIAAIGTADGAAVSVAATAAVAVAAVIVESRVVAAKVIVDLLLCHGPAGEQAVAAAEEALGEAGRRQKANAGHCEDRQSKGRRHGPFLLRGSFERGER